jgi:hypothetical protein
VSEAQLYLLPIVVYESDPHPVIVIVVVSMDHDLGCGVMVGQVSERMGTTLLRVALEALRPLPPNNFTIFGGGVPYR